jgi:HD-like signal output (HDOD) protein
VAIQSPVKSDSNAILAVIREELEDLPTLPTVVVRIMQTANDPTASATHLKNIIMRDPSLSAKVLRLVNSPYYGFAGKITTITHAIVVLGFGTVRNIATSLGVSKGLGSTSGPTALDLNGFWSHSVATACASYVLGRQKNLGAKLLEEVFVGGLLHDLGKLFLNRYFADQYMVTMRYARTAPCRIWDAELATLSIGHPMIGKCVAEKWNLPPATTSMIAYHHQPELAKEHAESVYIVHAADYLVRTLKIGNAGDDVEPVLSETVENWLNFLPNVWDGLGQATVTKYNEASTLLQAMQGR